MKEQTKTKIRGFVAAIVVLVVVSGVLAVGYISSTTASVNYATQLENNYQRSMYELMSDINSIENNLSKAIVSTGTETRQKLFNNNYKDCTQASEDLSRLPLAHSSVNQTTNFINQMGGFSYYAENKLKNGQTLSEDDEASLTKLYDSCTYIQTILNDFSATYAGRYNVLASTKNYDDDNNSFNSMFGNMQSENANFPTLIYDGPFSASQIKKEIKGLSQNTVTQEQAMEKVKTLYENAENLTFESETTGLFETYNFSLKVGERTVFVQVAKRDGFVLTISSYASSDKDEISLTDCEKKAEEFAQKLGLDLKAVWSTKVTGMAYINLTPIVNGVVIYPDMIKVKVSCKTGEVLGYEAQSYAYNHVERENQTASISESNARSKVNKSLNIESQRLTLIPVQYGNETLCYEYTCTLNNSTYYVYINAKTGEEQQILKVIQTTNGDLLM